MPNNTNPNYTLETPKETPKQQDQQVVVSNPEQAQEKLSRARLFFEAGSLVLLWGAGIGVSTYYILHQQNKINNAYVAPTSIAPTVSSCDDIRFFSDRVDCSNITESSLSGSFQNFTLPMLQQACSPQLFGSLDLMKHCMFTCVAYLNGSFKDITPFEKVYDNMESCDNRMYVPYFVLALAITVASIISAAVCAGNLKRICSASRHVTSEDEGDYIPLQSCP